MHSRSPRMTLRRLSTGQTSETLAHRGSVVAAAFRLDGARLVTASFDKTARVWDLPIDAGSADNWRRRALWRVHARGRRPGRQPQSMPVAHCPCRPTLHGGCPPRVKQLDQPQRPAPTRWPSCSWPACWSRQRQSRLTVGALRSRQPRPAARRRDPAAPIADLLTSTRSMVRQLGRRCDRRSRGRP